MSKHRYYKESFEEAQNSPRKTWSLINSIIKKQRNSKLPEVISLENGSTTNKLEKVADVLNTYFASIGEKIVSSVMNQFDSRSNKHFSSYLPSPQSNSIFLTPISRSEITKIVCDLNPGNSAGIDGSSSIIVKEILSAVILPLQHIINLSFKNGVFPSAFKEARIIPLHKGDSPENPSNYRPISILSAFSKIFEKAIYKRIYDFLKSFNFFTNSQFGFRSGHNTEHAIIALIQYIHECLDRGEIPATIYLDFKKAFDTISHCILFRKLDNCGVRGPALDLVKSYLDKRKQRIDGGNFLSSPVPQSSMVGVPQGSVLGPLLFLVYINDFHRALAIPCLSTHFADDTAVSISERNDEELEAKLDTAFSNVLEWCSANFIALNLSKTNFIIYGRKSNICPRITRVTSSKYLLSISRVNVIKYLGLMIDERLSFKTHIQNIRLKISRYVGLMRRLKHYLPYSALRSIYFALIQSNINYCSLVYLSTFKSHIKPIQILQNKAVRILKLFISSPISLPNKSSTASLYTYLDILPVSQQFTFGAIIFKFNYDIKKLPPYYLNQSLFSRSQDLHRYNTRQKKSIYIDKYSTERSKFAPFVSIARCWDAHKDFIDKFSSIHLIKRNLKFHLVQDYF